MNVTWPERMTFSFGSRFITERAKIVLPDPDSPTTPSVVPRFKRQRHAVDGAHPASRREEVRLEVLDLQQRLGLGLFYGPRRGGCSTHVVLVVSFIGVPPDTVTGGTLTNAQLASANPTPLHPPSSPVAKHASP